MAKRTFKRHEPEIDIATADLPLDKPVAVYYRQSTTAQVGNVSTTIQTIDLVEAMRKRGYAENKIILIDMDAGVSGTTAIDEREGMRQVFSLIVEGAIGAVACQDEDRLFRDVTQIQVNIFIEACRAAQVHIVTPSITYAFHHPTMGDFYKRQFRAKSEMAAEYLTFIKTRLVGAKNRKHREGFWTGERIPAGFMVDVRENSPTYHRLFVWEDVAEIVREVFRAFIACDGRAYSTIFALRDRGVDFSIIHNQKPPDGFYFPTNKGITMLLPTNNAIKNMVTNPMYIGHWMVNGEVVIWNNHEPIIDNATFFQAFNYVSPHSLDGSPNPHYVERHTRVHIKPDRPLEARPLLEGLVSVDFGGAIRPMIALWNSVVSDYMYYAAYRDVGLLKRMTRAKRVDEVVEHHFLERLSVSFNERLFAESITRRAEKQAKKLRAKRVQLAALKQDHETTLTNMTRASVEAAYQALEKRFVEIENAIRATETEITELQVETQATGDTRTALTVFRQALDNWHLTTADEKRRLFRLTVDRVVLFDEGDAVRVFEVEIHWKDGEVTRHEVWKRQVEAWTYADQLFLMQHLIARSPRAVILERFPTRAWATILRHVKRYAPDLLSATDVVNLSDNGNMSKWTKIHS